MAASKTCIENRLGKKLIRTQRGGWVTKHPLGLRFEGATLSVIEARLNDPTKPAARDWHLVPCVGAAHENPHIDHCGMCAPRWGWIEVPQRFKSVDEYRAAIDAIDAQEDR